MDTKELPSLQMLEEYFTYVPDSGNLVRKKTVNSRAQKGQVVGSRNQDGYLRVKINYVEYMVHRIVWKLVTREDIPPGMILDHIDRDRTNNKIENLRLSNELKNQNNRDPTIGVSYDSRTNQNLSRRWVVTLRGKKLGYYSTQNEAIEARKEALQKDLLRAQLTYDLLSN